MHSMILRLLIVAFVPTLSAAAPMDETRTVKVFLLAGQSNMEGQGVVDRIGAGDENPLNFRGRQKSI